MKLFEIKNGSLIINIQKSQIFIFIFTLFIFVSQVLIYQNLYAIISFISFMAMTLIYIFNTHQKKYKDDITIETGQIVNEIEFLEKNEITSETVGPECPNCKMPTILREAKYGKHKGKYFWGCSNFPKCRGILGVSEGNKLVAGTSC